MSPAPFLLDTCAALWAVDDQLSREASESLTESYRAGQTTYVSPITAWEIGVLASRGRFRSTLAPQRWFHTLMQLPGMALAELSVGVLFDSSCLPSAAPRDPADRIIIATAREYGYTVVTRDRAILDYANAGYLDALAC